VIWWWVGYRQMREEWEEVCTAQSEMGKGEKVT
jgi:hypothetical protein